MVIVLLMQMPCSLGQLVPWVKSLDIYPDWSQSSDSFLDDESQGGSTLSCNMHQKPMATLQLGED